MNIFKYVVQKHMQKRKSLASILWIWQPFKVSNSFENSYFHISWKFRHYNREIFKIITFVCYYRRIYTFICQCIWRKKTLRAKQLLIKWVLFKCPCSTYISTYDELWGNKQTNPQNDILMIVVFSHGLLTVLLFINITHHTFIQWCDLR